MEPRRCALSHVMAVGLFTFIDDGGSIEEDWTPDWKHLQIHDKHDSKKSVFIVDGDYWQKQYCSGEGGSMRATLGWDLSDFGLGCYMMFVYMITVLIFF